jgi:hypothetical protein
MQVSFSYASFLLVTYSGKLELMKTLKRISISLICWNASLCLAANLYTDETRLFLTVLKNDNAESALEYADTFVSQTIPSGKAKQNKYLALPERGKIALNAGRYYQCIADLQAGKLPLS